MGVGYWQDGYPALRASLEVRVLSRRVTRSKFCFEHVTVAAVPRVQGTGQEPKQEEQAGGS